METILLRFCFASKGIQNFHFPSFTFIASRVVTHVRILHPTFAHLLAHMFGCFPTRHIPFLNTIKRILISHYILTVFQFPKDRGCVFSCKPQACLATVARPNGANNFYSRSIAGTRKFKINIC